MANEDFGWKRFWCPREGRFSLADDGFLYDPESTHGRALNPDVVALESLLTTPCLVLLGEPGTGKSHELAAAKALATAHAQGPEDMVLAFDLRGYQTDQRLCARIFESQEFRIWREGQGYLQLFLDSLDESLLRVETVAALLEEELGRCPIGRLRLRIACRTAEWPSTLELALRKLWAEAQVKVMELVPLRKRDVKSAAATMRIDANSFIRAIVGMHAAPLALRPVTLKMLISLFRRNALLPSKRTELYEAGCSLLCDEPSLARRETRLLPSLSPESALMVASRIAAATVFSNRYAVWTNPDQSQMPAEDIWFGDLCGGTETVDGEPVAVTQKVVLGSLATGLFTSRGPHRMGWAHQTYAEFLAARYVVRIKMSRRQITGLLTHPQDPCQRVVPQLHETAAWAASLDAESFGDIMTRDPVVLLRSDVAAASPEDRERLVAELLPLFEREKLKAVDSRVQFAGLRHPRVSSQLSPYIRNKAVGWLVRRVAIDIALACDCHQCVPDLLAVALDPSDEYTTRVNAAYALEKIGTTEVKELLRPLARGDESPDPNDDLKGIALRANWPGQLTASELFHALHSPQRKNYMGHYSAFLFDLRRDVASQLTADDLHFALDWIARGKAEDLHFEEIREQIMLAAWRLILDRRDLAAPFARAAMSRLSRYDTIATGSPERPFSAEVRRDEARRRTALWAALWVVTDEQELRCLRSSETPLVLTEDLPWLAEQLGTVPLERRRLFARLMGWVYQWSEVGQLDIILDSCVQFPDIAEFFPWLRPVEIASPEGRKAKADWLRYKRLEKRIASHRSRPLLVPSPVERVKLLLVRFEGGDRSAWWRINREMTLEPDSTHYWNDLEWDLTALPVWKQAESPLRERLVSAARLYVQDPGPLDTSWVGTNVLHHLGLAGYRALALLHSHSPLWVTSLPASAAQRWAAAVVGYPFSSGDAAQMPHASILEWAYKAAPQETLAALGAMIGSESKVHDRVFAAGRMDHCWDDTAAAFLLAKAQESGLGPGAAGDLLDQLLGHEYQPAANYAMSLLSSPPASEGTARLLEVAAAAALIRHRPAECWDAIWRAIEADKTFGHELFEMLVQVRSAGSGSRFLVQLSEAQLGDTYLWLAAEYPHATDPVHGDGAHWVAPSESVRELRNMLLRHLGERGTEESCRQLRRIVAALPLLEAGKWMLLEAEEQTRRRTWVAPEPRAIVALGQDSQRRYVVSGGQLLDALCDSLDRLERTLQGEMAAAIDVWDNRGNMRVPQYYPKDELALSDYVARHLRSDLSDRQIVVNREVRIRRGELTDIHVDAVAPAIGREPSHTISAIIEVKGCWNRGLETDMEEQLVRRYLAGNQCPNGVFVIGWFNCDLWDAGDSRKRAAPRSSLADAREHFRQEAVVLEQKGLVPGLALRSAVLNAALR